MNGTVGGNAASKADVALGLRVKSGWATAVLLAGPVLSPQVLDQSTVELSDPAVPESRQPYHAGAGALETDEMKLSRRIQTVIHCTQASVNKLLQSYRTRGWNLHCAGLAVGSLVEPAAISNPHIRAHALEGQLFRTVLQENLSALGLRSCLIVERRAYAEAAALLSLSEAELKRKVSQLRGERNEPWRAEQKMAALVAWVALASPG
jgi:hypothetical protein